MSQSKASWDRATQQSFWRALTQKCAAIRSNDDYRAAGKWLDRMYSNIAMPAAAFAQADNRILLALMRAEDHAI